MTEIISGLAERAAAIVRSLTLTNILIIALLLVLLAPAYFAYRFLSDEQFRREFMQGGALLDKHLPCIVLETHAYGHATRHTVAVVYELDGRHERLFAMRAPGKWTDEELSTICQIVLNEAAQITRLKDAPRAVEQKP